MAEPKTQPTGASVRDFLSSIDDPARRKDCQTVAKLMQDITGAKPRMWGPAIVGFGSYQYANSSKKPYEWFFCGFSPRKSALTLYLMGSYPKDAESGKKLGKFKTGASCLYLKSLDDVNAATLKKWIADSVRRVEKGAIDYSK